MPWTLLSPSLLEESETDNNQFVLSRPMGPWRSWDLSAQESACGAQASPSRHGLSTWFTASRWRCQDRQSLAGLCTVSHSYMERVQGTHSCCSRNAGGCIW